MQQKRIPALFLSCLILYSAVMAETIRQDFNSMTDLNTFWNKSSWGGSNRTHSPNNVTVENGILALKLSGSQAGQIPVCAEITSKRSNFRYGSYRASIKTTNIAGGVVGWFVYRGSPLNEIDVEFLTEDISKVHYTLHHIQTSVDYTTYKLGYDASAGFHEYRFDWYADSVKYFIDGKATSTLKKQVPDLECTIMLNHWSGNIDGWGGNAPTQDIFMYVDYMYYSSDYSDVTPAAPLQNTAAAFKPASIQRSGDLMTLVFDNSVMRPSSVAIVSPLGKNVGGAWTGRDCQRSGGLVINTERLGQGAYLLVYDTPFGNRSQQFTIFR